MINFYYLTLFPELIQNYLSDALLNRAQKNRLLDFHTIQLRDYSDQKYKSIDDKPFGGGDGVVFEPEPVAQAIESVLQKIQGSRQIIYLTPHGKPLNQQKVEELSHYEHLIFLCGRYGGVDQRVINEFVDLEISVGPYVLSGGELPALTITEAVSRLIPGVLGDQLSAVQDSYSVHYGGGLEAPQYTRPQEWRGQKVPEILLSGDHQKILEWKKHMSEMITYIKRPDLIKNDQIEKNQEIHKKMSQMSELDLRILGLKPYLKQKGDLSE